MPTPTPPPCDIAISGASSVLAGEEYNFEVTSSRTIASCIAHILQSTLPITWESQTNNKWIGTVTAPPYDQGKTISIEAAVDASCKTDKQVPID